jgi:hypothetical protein
VVLVALIVRGIEERLYDSNRSEGMRESSMRSSWIDQVGRPKLPDAA